MDHTPHQEKIIKNYYRNRDAIMWQKLSELVTELYLAEGKKRDQIWKRIVTAMTNLKIPQDRIDHIVTTDNPAILATLVQNEMKKS